MRRAAARQAARWPPSSRRCTIAPTPSSSPIVDWLRQQPAHRDPADTAPASERGSPLRFDSGRLAATAGAAGRPDAARRGALQRLVRELPRRRRGRLGGRPLSLAVPQLVGRTAQPGQPGRGAADGRRAPPGERRCDDAQLRRHEGRCPADCRTTELAALANFVLQQFGDPAAAVVTTQDIAAARLGWRGSGDAERGARTAHRRRRRTGRRRRRLFQLPRAARARATPPPASRAWRTSTPPTSPSRCATTHPGRARMRR